MANRDWWNDERLCSIRERGRDLSRDLHFCGLNIQQAMKYTEPPDDEMAESVMEEQAEVYSQLAALTREHVALRRQVRAEYDAAVAAVAESRAHDDRVQP